MMAGIRRRLGSQAERRAAFQLLVACVREPDELEPQAAMRVISGTPSDVILALADYHGVAGLAYERLSRMPAAPERLVRELNARYLKNVERHMRVMWVLPRVQAALDEVGCRWAVFKGPVAVETLYERVPGRRQYLDLDVLVDPVAFADVLVALEQMGADLVDRNWLSMRRRMRGQVHFMLAGNLSMDLHWNLIDMDRRRMHIDTAQVLSRLQHLSFDGLTIPTFDNADGVTHLAFHAAYSGGDKLRWLKDIERATAVWEPDWQLIIDRARRWNVAAPVGMMLARSRDVLGAQVPHSVLSQLMSRRAATFERWVNAVSPWEYSMGRLAAPTRLLSRSIGHGALGGAAWVLSRIIRNLDPWQQARTSTLTARGGEGDRELFVQAIVASGRHGQAN